MRTSTTIPHNRRFYRPPPPLLVLLFAVNVLAASRILRASIDIGRDDDDDAILVIDARQRRHRKVGKYVRENRQQ
jgi:hypothetical protein